MRRATRSATPAAAAALVRHAKSDYDGDGITDIAVYRPSTSTFYALRSSNGTLLAFQFGAPGDIPLSGDYDGDGITDIAVFRPSTATFYALRTSDGTVLAFQFGSPGDMPLSGDYDGDGITDIAVYRPSTSTFYALRTSNGTLLAFQFGAPSDIPLSGDYDGDGITDLAVFRPSIATFYALRTSNGTLLAFAFGAPGDIPLSGDYDGDGITDLAVYRPSTNTFYALRTSNGTLLAFQFGSSGDIPLSAYGVTSIQITGQVTAGGTGVSGVTVTLSGDISTSTTTDANGNYSFVVPAGGSYTVTPSLSGQSFTPGFYEFDDLSGSQTADFAESTSSGSEDWNGFWDLPINSSATPSGTSCDDISGTWTETDQYGSSTWNLTEDSSGNVSGTVDFTNGGSCGTITYQTVTGSESNGVFTLTASNPTALQDSCGNPITPTEQQNVTLSTSGSCSDGSASWSSNFG